MLDDFTATDTLSALDAELHLRASLCRQRDVMKFSILNEDHDYVKFDGIGDEITAVYSLVYSISFDR